MKGDITQAKILEAARRLFADRGRERTTIRAVAAEAGVDPALVMHYFGSKDRLFGAATELPIDRQALANEVIRGDPEQLADRMLVFALGLWGEERTGPALRAIVRAALADSSGAARVSEAVGERVLRPLGAATGKPDGELRAALAFSQGIGLAIARHLMGIPALAALSDDEVRSLVEPNLRRYLSGELTEDVA